jgi:RNA polymerase sigma-70 factor, ECF subfamily
MGDAPDAGDAAALAGRAAAGDYDAFASLLRLLSPSWFRVALGFVGDARVAEEVVQDVAVRVFFALPSWRRDASIRTWTHRIVVNICHDTKRRGRAAQRVVPLDTPEALRVATPVKDIDPAAHDALTRAVAELPSDLRAVVSLRYGAAMGFAEIAAVLGIPIGTVSSRLRRALAELAKRLPAALCPD